MRFIDLKLLIMVLRLRDKTHGVIALKEEREYYYYSSRSKVYANKSNCEAPNPIWFRSGRRR